jgi:hypothetical protein
MDYTCNMAAVQNLYSAWVLIAVTNEPVELDIWFFYGDTRKWNTLARRIADHNTLDDP